MSYCYRIFGFSVASNEAIPGLDQNPPSGSDFEILFGSAPANEAGSRSGAHLFRSTNLTEAGDPAFDISSIGDLIHIRYQEGFEFWFDPGRGKIWGVWRSTLGMSDAATLLLGPVFGLMLAYRGTPCLHASAIEIGGAAILFAGDAGAGKSTMAAAMSRRGHAVLSDDIVPISDCNGGFLAVPSYPYLSLCPDTVENLYGPAAALPNLSENFHKQRLPLGRPSHVFQESALPLGMIFVLSGRSLGPGVPRVENMTPREGVLSLVVNSYSTYVLDPARRAKEFQFFGRLACAAPVMLLRPHHDPQLLGRLCDLVEQTANAFLSGGGCCGLLDRPKG